MNKNWLKMTMVDKVGVARSGRGRMTLVGSPETMMEFVVHNCAKCEKGDGPVTDGIENGGGLVVATCKTTVYGPGGRKCRRI